MSAKRYSVKDWNGVALQAASMSVGICKHADTVGVDMLAQDGTVFAHGHFDIETAESFYRSIGEAIQLCRARSNPQ